MVRLSQSDDEKDRIDGNFRIWQEYLKLKRAKPFFARVNETTGEENEHTLENTLHELSKFYQVN